MVFHIFHVAGADISQEAADEELWRCSVVVPVSCSLSSTENIAVACVSAGKEACSWKASGDF
jgi:hypothetical protein